jgi:hypothetical protein
MSSFKKIFIFTICSVTLNLTAYTQESITLEDIRDINDSAVEMDWINMDRSMVWAVPEWQTRFMVMNKLKDRHITLYSGSHKGNNVINPLITEELVGWDKLDYNRFDPHSRNVNNESSEILLYSGSHSGNNAINPPVQHKIENWDKPKNR